MSVKAKGRGCIRFHVALVECFVRSNIFGAIHHQAAKILQAENKLIDLLASFSIIFP